MNLPKKIAHLFALIFLATSLFSCTEGCVEADEFDSQSINIESKPVQIYGSYEPANGGQRVDWNDPSLRSNGTEFLMEITGSWTSLQGTNADTLEALPRCNTCAKKDGIANCICYESQEPTAEKDPSGQFYTKAADGATLNCASSANHQDDSVRCTCTKQHGKATDYGIHHFPRDLLYKDETVKLADKQSNCKYDRGMGAYMALWGSRGVTTPTRTYHLFSEETICNVLLNAQGKCLDSSGNDRTRYIFRSANSRIFMKDDHDGNDDKDTNTANDEYHTSNEYLKTIMYDTYYQDNFGKYNVQILRGVGNAKDDGLLESLVSVVEDALLGKIDDDGKRPGGIIRFMYLAVVQDSGFSSAMQMSLIFYVALFGAAHIWGLVEMNRKELTSRMLKIALVMFFVSPTSWYVYNQFIVGFFMDGMNYVIGMFMSLSDANIEQTSMIKIAQMDRMADTSSATRFAYIDLIIKKLMSMATAKKIAALFFSDFFGLFYMVMIYVVIFVFIAVMLIVATIYVTNLIKLIFVLSIGPIFIVFTLFTRTASYFNNWLGYIAGRSFEMIILFIVLYLFVTIIDKNFTEMLSYRVCSEPWGIGPLKLTILKTVNFNRDFPQWLLYFAAIGGLIWVMNDLIDKLPNVTAALFSLKISGKAASHGVILDTSGNAANYSSGSSGAIAGGIAGMALSGAVGVGNRIIAPAALIGMSALGSFANTTGISSLYNSATSGLPNNPVGASFMNQAMNSAMSAGQGKNAEGKEGAIRAAFMDSMRAQMAAQPLKMTAMGVNEKSLTAFMDQKLVNEPLKGFIAEAAKEMKGLSGDKMPIGKAAENFIKDRALELAKDKMSALSLSKAAALLEEKGMKNLMRDSSSLTAAQAGKAFAGNKEQADKFRAHLAERQAEKKLKDDRAWKNPISLGLVRLAGNIYHGLPMTNTPHRNPGRMQGSFERALDQKENPKPWHAYVNPLKPFTSVGNVVKQSDFLDKHVFSRSKIAGMADEARLNAMRSQLENQKTRQDLDSAKINKERKQMMKDNAIEDKKRDFFQQTLRDKAKQDALDTLKSKPILRAETPVEEVERMGNMQSKRNELLREFGKNDGRTLFEKAETLSQLNKLLGIGGKDPQIELANMINKKGKETGSEDDLKKGLFAKELDEKTAKEFADKERARNEITSKDHKSDKDIDESLREAQKRALDELAKKKITESDSADAAKKLVELLLPNKEASIQSVKDADKALTIMEEATKKAATVTTLEEKAAILDEAKKQVTEFVATSFKVEFGASISDALMKESNIGLKAGSILLDAAQNKVGPVDEKILAALEVNSHQAHGQLKMAKMDKQMKEMEIAQAEASGDSKKASELRSELGKLEKSLLSIQGNYDSLTQQLKSLK